MQTTERLKVRVIDIHYSIVQGRKISKIWIRLFLYAISFELLGLSSLGLWGLFI